MSNTARRGRPKIYPEKRGTLTFRLRPEIREHLSEAAMLNGRSLSQEVEFRLEMSFRDEPSPELMRWANDLIESTMANFVETLRPSSVRASK